MEGDCVSVPRRDWVSLREDRNTKFKTCWWNGEVGKTGWEGYYMFRREGGSGLGCYLRGPMLRVGTTGSLYNFHHTFCENLNIPVSLFTPPRLLFPG